MNSLEFVTLATSKDTTRFNLQEVFRDTDAFVATDGHRLHWSDAPKIEKGHFISGLDAEFPDWKHINPLGKEVPQSCFSFLVDKTFLARFKVLQALAKAHDPKCQEIKLAAAFAESGNHLVLSTKSELLTGGQSSIQASIRFELVDSPTKECSFNLNASYLLDVISAAHAWNKNRVQIEVIYFGQGKPIVFKINSLGNAIIMPINAKD